MIWNIVLLFLVFGAQKKKMNAYWAALLLGGLKGVIYLVFTRDALLASIMAVIFAGLASALVYFLKRLDRPSVGAKPSDPVYRSTGAEKMAFQWEYIPLVALLLLIIGGEAFLR